MVKFRIAATVLGVALLLFAAIASASVFDISHDLHAGVAGPPSAR
ncbi:MAG TPA: hypothetical protein VGJ70_14890 [Solirubrobacteraceae bacterium]|jgi:hypothetical protein